MPGPPFQTGVLAQLSKLMNFEKPWRSVAVV